MLFIGVIQSIIDYAFLRFWYLYVKAGAVLLPPANVLAVRLLSLSGERSRY